MRRTKSAAEPKYPQAVQPFLLESWISLVASLALFGLKGFCLVDAVLRPSAAYITADKNRKELWVLLLALSVVAHLLSWAPLGILNLAGTIAACVYALDVRPAVRELTRPR